MPNGSGGAGSLMPSSFSRRSAPAGREPSPLTNRIVEFVSIFFPSFDSRRSPTGCTDRGALMSHKESFNRALKDDQFDVMIFLLRSGLLAPGFRCSLLN